MRDEQPPEAVAAGEESGDPHLRSTNEVGGYDIQATDDEVGHVEDFIVDDQTWEIRFLVIDTSNWWFGKKVLLPPNWIDRIGWPYRKASAAYCLLRKGDLLGKPLQEITSSVVWRTVELLKAGLISSVISCCDASPAGRPPEGSKYPSAAGGSPS